MTFAAMNLSSNLQLGSSSWKLNNRTVAPHVIIRRVIVHLRRLQKVSGSSKKPWNKYIASYVTLIPFFLYIEL